MRTRRLAIALSIACTFAVPPAVHADVTTQETLSTSLGGSFQIDTTTTTYTTADKQRRESQAHCGTLMSYFCNKVRGADITRLDKGVTWQLLPAKKSYLETRLPTAEERAAARARMEETIAKLQQCQKSQPQPTQTVDRSKCDMSPPTVTVHDDGPRQSILGHDTQEHSVVIGQTCTNRETGDVCEFRYGFDVWLTPDKIAGLEEKRDFTRAYLKRMGLDESDSVMQGQVQRFMAQYADTLKDLASKAQNFKGTPLKTAFRLSIGGEHCGQAQRAQGSQASAAGSGSSSGSSSSPSGPSLPPTNIQGAAAKLLGGLFAKKNASANPPADGSSTAGNSSASSTTASGTAGAPMLTVAAFTTETTAITPGPIAAEQFEIPPGWTQQTPPPVTASNKLSGCGSDSTSD